MKTRTRITNMVTGGLRIIWAVMAGLALASCLGEAKEKFNKAKEGVSNATTIVKEAQKAEGRMEKLKNKTALTNAQLKEWLPTELGNLERSGFKVGQAGYAGVNSVEGTFKSDDSKKKISIAIIDAAGPSGGVMAAGYGMFGNLEMEMEDAHKHQQTVTVDGIKAQQTYFKKRNSTQLIFMYGERFLGTVNSTDMDVEATWALIEKLDLEELVDMTE